jgi:polyhydroxyalkanoate synthase subunit PhaC
MQHEWCARAVSLPFPRPERSARSTVMKNANRTHDFDKLVEGIGLANRILVEGMARQFAADQPDSMGRWLRALHQALSQDSERWQELQQEYYRRQVELFFQAMARKDAADQAGARGDRRFAAEEWSRIPLFDYIRRSYEMTSQWLLEAVGSLKLDDESRRKALFYTRQYIDAMAPSNFPATNPEVLRLALETKGESVAAGLRNLIDDLAKGRISMTDEAAFEVGRNIAVSAGAVVFENELVQLIQYRPLTDEVAEVPLLMVPPCINKFYIMDLEPDNSLVRFAVEQGHTVFMVSWRNAPAELGGLAWDDYIERGVISAIDAVCAITGRERINALGFCIGGTLLACALAVLRAKGRDPAQSLTLMTTLLDFSDVGDIGVYVDADFVSARERLFRSGGLVAGRELATAFSSLRANDLIWFYVINNYLKGRTPEAFNLLYWNSDATNLPGPMYVWYLRHCYLENRLRDPGALTVCGAPVDLSRIDAPAFVFAARDDHIVPWRSAYAGARLLRGPVEFVLGASGHIAGAINPASRNKRNYWTSGAPGPDPDRWLASAEHRPGSWWLAWSRWISAHAGRQVAARRRLGGRGYKVREPAPGRYVRERCEPAA